MTRPRPDILVILAVFAAGTLAYGVEWHQTATNGSRRALAASDAPVRGSTGHRLPAQSSRSSLASLRVADQDPAALREAPTGAPLHTGTASWFASYGSGSYGAVRSYRWGQPRYWVTVTGPRGTARVLVRDACWCIVNGKRRLIDLGPAAFKAVCGPLWVGLCTVTVKGMR